MSARTAPHPASRAGRFENSSPTSVHPSANPVDGPGCNRETLRNLLDRRMEVILESPAAQRLRAMRSRAIPRNSKGVIWECATAATGRATHRPPPAKSFEQRKPRRCVSGRRTRRRVQMSRIHRPFLRFSRKVPMGVETGATEASRAISASSCRTSHLASRTGRRAARARAATRRSKALALKMPPPPTPHAGGLVLLPPSLRRSFCPRVLPAGRSH